MDIGHGFVIVSAVSCLPTICCISLNMLKLASGSAGKYFDLLVAVTFIGVGQRLVGLTVTFICPLAFLLPLSGVSLPQAFVVWLWSCCTYRG